MIGKQCRYYIHGVIEMADLKNDRISEDDVKKTDNSDSAEIVITPEDEYEKAFKRRKKLSLWGLVLLTAAEITVAGGLGRKIKADDLQYRVLKEYEMRSSGQIQLTKGLYAGETDFGYFSGKGQFLFETGAEYTGGWKQNQLKGNGNLRVPNEGNYRGEFSASKKSGNGTFTWDDGVVYEGEWKNDKMCGQGTYTTPDGVIFSGTFKDNAFQGGACTFKNNTGSYNLTYKLGVIDKVSIEYTDGSTYVGKCDTKGLTGTGKMTFVSGDIYDGAFLDGYRNGQGAYTWISGDKYDGEWASDQMNGSGTYTYSDGSYASGTFDKNAFVNGSYHIENDFGTYTFTITDGQPTAVEMSLASGTTYSGAMSDGQLSGQAQIKYSNGDQYNGNVSNGQKSGQGTYTWTSGASYEGKWSDDQMNGNGTYYYPSGEDGYKLAGSFENGKPNGEFQYYTNSSTHYQTDWKNGKCVKIYE